MVKKLYSFDIFDTLITRTTANPDGIFLLIENKLKTFEQFKNLSYSLKNNFCEIRKSAQIFCITNQLIINQKFDCSFDDIYETIKNNFDLTHEEKELLKNTEIETEFENILPIQKNIDKLKKLILSNEKVILISDMYFSSNIIRKFLLKFDKIFENIEIYTSGETGKLKTDGLLFQLVKKKYPDYKQIHYGDDKVSDFLAPKFNKINSERYFKSSFKPYENMVLEKNQTHYSELSTGISRYLRTQNKNKAFILGCSFAAPILFSYVYWVLEQAEKRNLKHLYFVARDGFVLKIIADEIITQTNLDIKTHYFYSSRLANRIPDKTNFEKYIINYSVELLNLMTVEFLAKRLNIEVADLKKYINIKINTTKQLSKKETQILVEQILNNKDLKQLIIEKNKIKKDLFIKYIKQEIDLTKNDFAFVESNGSGRTQDYVADFITQESNIKNIKTFYLISLPRMVQKENSTKFFYYYPGEFLADYIEILCRTQHGQTIGYKEENGKIVPVLETEKYDAMIKWGFEDYIEGIRQYSGMFSKYMFVNSVKSSDTKFFSVYFDYYRYKIDKETKNKISKIPFLIFGNETKAKNSLPTHNPLCVLTDKTTFKHFLARKFHKTLQKVLLIIILFCNSKKMSFDEIEDYYFLYYRYFIK